MALALGYGIAWLNSTPTLHIINLMNIVYHAQSTFSKYSVIILHDCM